MKQLRNVDNADGFKGLAAAIIGQACDDYINYHLKTAKTKDYYEAKEGADADERRIKRVRASRLDDAELNYKSACNFLDDDNAWFVLLADGVSARYLIEQCDKRIKEKKGERNDNKRTTRRSE